jgi:nitrogen fixation protein NifU and related proteins
MQINNPTDLSSQEPLTEEQEIYKENIIDHYKHPHNKHKLENATCVEKGINPLCGDHLEIYLKIESEKVVDVGFEGDGCAISQASISLLTDAIKGKKISEVLALTESDVYELLGIPISHTRRKCALLSLNTVHKALEKD